jgi:hypothetical protein
MGVTHRPQLSVATRPPRRSPNKLEASVVVGSPRTGGNT